MNLCHDTISQFWIEFLVGGIVLRGIVGGFITAGIKGGLKYLFLPTERHFIYYIHYFNQGKKNGHLGTPNDCRQGLCKGYN